jgi:hypothetical protein
MQKWTVEAAAAEVPLKRRRSQTRRAGWRETIRADMTAQEVFRRLIEEDLRSTKSCSVLRSRRMSASVVSDPASVMPGSPDITPPSA